MLYGAAFYGSGVVAQVVQQGQGSNGCLFECIIFQTERFDGFYRESEIPGICLKSDHRIPDIGENFICSGTVGLREQTGQFFFNGFAFGGFYFYFL